MKGKILLMCVLMGSVFTACLKDDLETVEQQYTQLCIQTEFGDGYLYTSDTGQKLYATKLPADYEFEQGGRVLISFTLLTEMEAGLLYDYVIDLKSISDVPVKSIIEINEENKDTIGNAGVVFNQIRVSGRFLDVDFSFWGKEKKHLFNVSYDPQNQPEEEDQIRLVFHHKDYEDEKYSMYRGITSFDLETLGQPLIPPYTIKFEGKDAYGRDVKFDVEVKK